MTALFEDHLTLDAIVAFTDGEMSLIAYQRAAAHLSRCPHCAAEVQEQASAREFLRSAEAPRMPGSLLDALRSIPVAVPACGSGAVQVRGAVPVQREHRGVRGRRFRLGAGALVAGLTLGLTAGAVSDAPHDPAVGGTHTALPGSSPFDPPGRS
ncbi:hypothetical protein JL107_00835 [Nakamurella flavida]|uniref:Putative zinc-finger domain-containing protein n=1 Tax=Nakamurella flavida TaxID=363630 RepID=A0A938YHR5_9ACTN|nr:zf-HC2 domain-containing protein [Nakamurella flavida]MBM9474978.1 hypothetical protein [Nakamurella flavida]MDP9776547.1 anti-sigma factor RsiW [Nakamurella flavida]